MAGPGRPQNWPLMAYALNGAPVFLGRLVCTTTAVVNNATTATPFNQTPRDAGNPSQNVGPNYENTLAGKSLILQSMDNAFLVLPGDTAADLNVTAITGANPGLRVGVGERFNWIQPQDKGWLKVIAEAGTATIQVWELL